MLPASATSGTISGDAPTLARPTISVTGGPQPLAFAPLQAERRLEDMIVQDPALAGLPNLVVRQVATSYGGFIDVVGVDQDGHVHVVELKRDRTPREVVAQILDYGSWAADLTIEDAIRIWGEQQDGSFEDAFAERFNLPPARPLQRRPTTHDRLLRTRSGVGSDRDVPRPAVRRPRQRSVLPALHRR